MSRLLDPLVGKELTAISRRWQTYLARVIYVGLIGALLYSFWDAVRVTEVSEFANLGRRLFRSFFWVQFLWVSAVAVFGAADLVTREVRSGMLGLLALTPLDAADVAWGKWKAAMAGSLSLVLCGLPVTAVCVYAGGAGLEELCWSTALTVAAAGVSAAHGILGAAKSPTPVAAVLRAGWEIAKAILLFTLITGLFGPVFSAPFHPLFAAMAAAEHGGINPVLAWLWIITLPFCLWRVRRILARAELDLRARGFGGPFDAPPDPRLGPMDPILRFLYLHGFRSLEPPAWLLESFPLVWKELVSRAAVRAVRIWQVPWIFFMLAGAVFGLTIQEPAPAVVATVIFAALLIVLAAGSALFAPERDQRRWDGLLAAPLSSSRIVAAKLLAPLLTPEAGALLVVVALTVAGWGGLGRLEAGLPGTIAATLLFIAFAYVLAAFASLHARTPRLAFLASSGLLFALLGLWATSLLPPWFQGLNPTAWVFASRGGRLPFGVEYLSAYAGATAFLVASMIWSLRRVAAKAS